MYVEGSLKRDPVSKSVAIRTVFDDQDYPNLAWLIATTNVGPRTVSYAEVESWEDVPLD